MRAYYVEDLRDETLATIEEHFKKEGFKAPIEDIYYLSIPSDLLTDEQKEHFDKCGPYFLGLEVMRNLAGNKLKMELLVRAQSIIRCSCVSYCTPEQRNHMIDYLDDMIKSLDIAV